MMDYRGCQTKTLCGAICQDWSSQSPNIHKTTAANYPDAGLGRHNYCRNPTRAERAWCYTVDGVHRWEYCLPLDVGTQIGEHIPEDVEVLVDAYCKSLEEGRTTHFMHVGSPEWEQNVIRPPTAPPELWPANRYRPDERPTGPRPDELATNARLFWRMRQEGQFRYQEALDQKMLLVVAPLGVLLIALFGLGLGIKFRRALMLTSAVQATHGFPRAIGADVDSESAEEALSFRPSRRPRNQVTRFDELM